MSKTQPVSPEVQKAYIENSENKEFLPSLRFIPLKLSELKKHFTTPEERLDIIVQLYELSCGISCDFFKGDLECEEKN